MTDDICKVIRPPQGDENVTGLVLCTTLIPPANVATRKKKNTRKSTNEGVALLSYSQSEGAFGPSLQTQGILAAIQFD